MGFLVVLWVIVNGWVNECEKFVVESVCVIELLK